MAYISTAQQKRHLAVTTLLNSNAPLSSDEIELIFADFHEGAANLNGIDGAFFTPPGLARDFAICVEGNTVIDLCAGIGSLSHACSIDSPERAITCVELTEEYAKVGRKLVPQASWITKDVCSISKELQTTDKFDVAISNPPFGTINGIGMFDLEVVRIASKIAKRGVFILPQQSTPFRYSGRQAYKEETSDRLKRWMDKTGIEFKFNIGIDCNVHLNEWKGVKPVVEIVLCDFGG